MRHTACDRCKSLEPGRAFTEMSVSSELMELELRDSIELCDVCSAELEDWLKKND